MPHKEKAGALATPTASRGLHDDRTNSQRCASAQDEISAEIIGSDTATAIGATVHVRAPVLPGGAP
jgi:hypothetical protein